MNELPTLEQAEDAAATALALLLEASLTRRRPDRQPLEQYPAPLTVPWPDLVAACRELLRGPLAEDYSRRPGGYCMRGPSDPTLRAIGQLGARLVELSYTAPAHLAVAEADELWARLRKEIDDGQNH